jgi:uncharacterized protein (UPF0276 family)
MSEVPQLESIPAQAGIGLRSVHHREVLHNKPSIPWFEVHSENFFGAGGLNLHYLDTIRSDYPLSLHGVGLSLGSTDPLDREHLGKLKRLMARCQPGLVSEHLAWSSVAGRHLNDLLPLPYTEESLQHIAQRIAQVQDTLGRQILIENLSSYVRYNHATIPEWEFLAAVSQNTGCGILLDINNIYVSAVNHDFDPYLYIHTIPSAAIQELHLAGFHDAGGCLIDTHGTPVAETVWQLYRYTLRCHGTKPTLIEWDTDIPALAVLLHEAAKAQAFLEATHDAAA